MNNILATGSIVLALILSSSCTVVPKYAYSNKKLYPEESIDTELNRTAKASEKVNWKLNHTCRNKAESNPERLCKKDNDDFIGITISGGGTRSAVFSAAVLFELQHYGLLQQADVVTCVSGGCITAAYYALSCNPEADICLPAAKGRQRPVWNEKELFDKSTRNYELRWIGNWFWPDNIARYWFTYYDRTDIMAETLSDNFYDTSLLGGKPFRFKDLNYRRPNLLISATNSIEEPESPNSFLFSNEQFSELDSNLDRFRIANAVMASSTFPGVFQYVTLRDFSEPDKTYVHLFDGGTLDNLGLIALEKTIKESVAKASLPKRSVIISIDAFPLFKGTDPEDPEPRDFIDYFVDTNFLDAYSALLASIRKLLVNKSYEEIREQSDIKDPYFMHITFADFEDDEAYNNMGDIVDDITATIKEIGTDFSVTPQQGECLRFAAHLLVENKIKALVEKGGFEGLVTGTAPAYHPIANEVPLSDNPCEHDGNGKTGT